MATLTIRNLNPALIARLKERAKRRGHSMEQEAREILDQRLATRSELLSEMKARWSELPHHPSAEEVDSWIKGGRKGRR